MEEHFTLIIQQDQPPGLDLQDEGNSVIKKIITGTELNY